MYRRIILVVWLVFIGLSSGAQNLEDLMKSFDDFAQRTDDEFEAFRRRTQKEFGEFLKQSWQEFELMQGEELPATPEPITPRIAEPETYNSMVRLPDGVETGRSLSLQQRQNAPLSKPSNNNPSAKYDDTRVSFFGSSLNLPFDRKFVIRLRSAREADVGDYWIRLADADFLLLIYSCRLVKEALGLNDWGYYQLVREVAKSIYPAAAMYNERTVFMAFILDETGYDVRIARNVDNGKLALMSAFESKVYFTPFFEASSKRYYIPGENSKGGRIATYRSYAKEEKRRFDLKIDRPLKLKDNPATFEIADDIMGVPLKITYNRNAIDFYNTIPVTDLDVYFNSRGSAAVLQSFEEVLKPVVGKMSEKDAATALLRLMHHAFEYKTDREQFGYERPFFFEELFSYPYNNCKDRSVLYAFLIRQLIGLQVVGLKYTGHVATAVRFNERVNGHYISMDGEVYIICDPTNINAAIGQPMEGYATARAEMIRIEN